MVVVVIVGEVEDVVAEVDGVLVVELVVVLEVVVSLRRQNPNLHTDCQNAETKKISTIILWFYYVPCYVLCASVLRTGII